MLQIIVLTSFISNCYPLYSESFNVIELTDTNFEDLVINSDTIWIVKFFDPGCKRCQKFVPEYEKAARALKGIVKVGAVNVDLYNDLAIHFNITRFPTTKIFNVDINLQNYKAPHTANDLVYNVLTAMRKRINMILNEKQETTVDVVQLTDRNFDELVMQSKHMWLVVFYGPWCTKCEIFKINWEKAATKLKRKVKLGVVDVTVSPIKASHFSIQKYPTIKYFPFGKKYMNYVLDYDGGNSVDEIVIWVLKKLKEDIPVPKIIQLVDDVLFNELCNKDNLCVISFLPHILDCQTECRMEYLDTLNAVSEKYKTNMWEWLWSEAGAQSALENVFGIGRVGYPAMAVVNVKKMKYSLLRGSFSKNNIDEFLHNISDGRGCSATIEGAKLPKIVEIDSWDQFNHGGNLDDKDEL